MSRTLRVFPKPDKLPPCGPLPPPTRPGYTAPERNGTRAALDIYCGEARRYGTLTLAQELALARRVRSGDQAERQAAREALVMGNLGLVLTVAARFRTERLPVEDLVSEGNLALWGATARYCPSHGVKFGSFAGNALQHRMQRAIANQGRTVRVPEVSARRHWRIWKAGQEMEQKLHRAVTAAELALHLGIKERTVERSLIAMRDTLPMDAPCPWIGSDGQTAEYLSLKDMLPDDASNPAQAHEAVDLAQWVKTAVSSGVLDDRERSVVSMRFGLDGREPMVLWQVAAVLRSRFSGHRPLTGERTRQIEVSALVKLRAAAARDGVTTQNS